MIDWVNFLLIDYLLAALVHSLSRWYIRPYRQAVTRPPVMFECFMVTLPSEVFSRCSGCSRTRWLAKTDGYTYLVPNFPSNWKSIFVSASSTSCPQELASSPAQRTNAHTCGQKWGWMWHVFYKPDWNYSRAYLQGVTSVYGVRSGKCSQCIELFTVVLRQLPVLEVAAESAITHVKSALRLVQEDKCEGVVHHGWDEGASGCGFRVRRIHTAFLVTVSRVCSWG